MRGRNNVRARLRRRVRRRVNRLKRRVKANKEVSRISLLKKKETNTCQTPNKDRTSSPTTHSTVPPSSTQTSQSAAYSQSGHTPKPN